MYLRKIDYLPFVQDQQLSQIITANDSLRIMAERSAQEEVISYLKQKYDTVTQFKDTNVFNPQLSYKSGDLVYLDGPIWVQSAYPVNSIVVVSGLVYIALANTTTVPGSKITDWFFIGNQYDLFYACVPVGSVNFDYTGVYNLNDVVFRANATWTCNAPTITPSHFSDIQAAYVNQIGQTNIAPDDPINKDSFYWTKTADYAIAAGVLPTDADFWTPGDNRSELIKMHTIFITLFRLVRRIAPKNVPERFQNDYDNSITWLQQCADGDINAPITPLQPKQGQRIRFGGMVKSQNYY